MIHALKIAPEYFNAIINGKKTFEVLEDDRVFMEGDLLALNEHEPDYYTGRSCIVEIVYILDNEEYCKDGYIIIGFRPCDVVKSVEFDLVSQKKLVGVPLATDGINPDDDS